MKISVVIPCFNERNTIEQIVRTVRTSPVQNLEIIVVDDCSTDGTIEILREKVASVADQIVYQPTKLRQRCGIAGRLCRCDRRRCPDPGR